MEIDHIFVKGVEKKKAQEREALQDHFKKTYIKKMFLLMGGYKIAHKFFIQDLSSDRVSSGMQLLLEEEMRW